MAQQSANDSSKGHTILVCEQPLRLSDLLEAHAGNDRAESSHDKHQAKLQVVWKFLNLHAGFTRMQRLAAIEGRTLENSLVSYRRMGTEITIRSRSIIMFDKA